MRRVALAGFGLVVLAGCEPLFAVEGNAQTLPRCGGAADPYAGSAAVGAAVLVRCPRSPDRRIGQLDARGHLHYQVIGDVETSCAIVVEKDGYWPATLPVADVCVDAEGAARCHLVSFAVDLAPK